MWRGKVQERIRAQKLRAAGRSVKEIARHLGVAKSSVSVWVRSVRLTATQRRHLQMRELRGGAKGQRAMKRYWEEYHKLHPKPAPKGPRWPKRDVENFFDTWTPEMAYVLGYFAADGCMYKNKRGSCYIGFVSTGKELIVTVKRLTGVTNAIEEYQSPKPNHKRRYALQIGSKKIFQRFLEIGLTPAKSLIINFPKIPEEVLGHFVRGYFDGDGCACYIRHFAKDRGYFRQAFFANFTCGSKKFLRALQESLHQCMQIGQGSFYGHDGAYRLTYSGRAARQLYNFMYPSTTVPCLERKRNKFHRAFKELGPVV